MSMYNSYMGFKGLRQLTLTLFFLSFWTFFFGNSPTNASYIDLTFTGDLMAHVVNFKMKDYSLIYKDVENLLKTDDLSFVNFETPVTNSRDYETYPTFNVKKPYAEAAINAGFDVFSLANNHTNDQGSVGIAETFDFFSNYNNKNTLSESRQIYSAGIKPKKNTGFTYQVIEIKGWTILYMAVTEIVNQWTDLERIDYVQPTEKARNAFKTYISKIRKENPCDLFILSIHNNAEEYVRTVSQSQKTYYYSLLDIGVDIIWSNHPHVTQEWEIIQNKDTGVNEKLIMYCLGNVISGQRGIPNYDNPDHKYEYTGDSIFMQVSVIKNGNGIKIDEVIPKYVTTHITPTWKYVIQQLNDDFVNSQQTKLADYYRKRLELMKEITGKIICR